MLLYLTGWRSGPQVLLRLIQKWDKPFIYVAGLERFRRQRGSCQFTGSRGDEDYFPGMKQEVAPPAREEARPTEASPAPASPPQQKALEAVARVQEAPQKASLDAAKEEPAQWGGGPKINPYAHLPPYQRPEEYRY
jgi:hypothetical protein